MNEILKDIRYSLRLLASKPGFSAVIVLALGLGIATNVTLFTIVNVILFRPLPFEREHELVRIHETMPQLDLAGVAPANFEDWKNNNHVFSHAAVFLRAGFATAGREDTRIIFGFRVSSRFFDVLRVRAALGRTFVPDEDQPAASRVAVVSYRFWQSLSGDSKMIGQTLILADDTYTIIGVMPADFWFSSRNTDVWVPLRFTPADLLNRGRPNLGAVARLLPGVTIRSAGAEMTGIAQQMERQFPAANRKRGMRVIPLADDFRPSFLSTILVLQGAACFVLLIACANVANLLLVSATSRRQEFAVRAALGAQRWQLIRQMFIESGILSVLGGAAGLAMSCLTLGMVCSRLPERVLTMLPVSNLNQLGIDIRVVSFTAGISLATLVAFGLVPALAASRTDLNHTLKDSGRTMGIGRGARLFAQALVIGEIGISMVLLVGAGLLVKSFLQIMDTDLGFNPQHILKMGIDLSRRRYPDSQKKLAFYQDLLKRVQAIPGTLSAGLIDQALPIGNATDRGSIFNISGLPVSAGHEPRALIFSVDARYFRTMQIPLAAGREFTPSDTAGSLPVAVISRSVAHRYFSNENPIGRQLRTGPAESQEPLLTIVGVVGDVRNPLALGPQLTIYRLYLQNQNPAGDLVIRTAIEPKSMTPQLRKEIRALDSSIPDIGVASMEDSLADAVSQPRFSMGLLTFFAGLALLLVALGVYGVTYYLAAQRVHEIGVRMAMGAQRNDILKLIAGAGLRIAAIGVAIGVAAALGLTSLMRNQLFGVSATDPATFAILSAFLIVVSLAASFVPACRATRVDPLAVLRRG